MDIDRNRRTFLTAAAGTLALAGVASAQENATGNATGNVSEEASGEGEDREPQTHTVEMITDGSEYIFDPVGLHVQPGDTVEWVITSGAHSTTAYAEGNGPATTTRIPDGAEPWDSGTLTGEGSSFSYTFEEEGTYDYFCIPHKTLGMVGRIVCGEPGGPASGSTPPDDVGSGQFPTEDAIVEEGSLAYPWEGSDGDESGGGGDGGEEGDGSAGGGPTQLPATVKTLGWGAVGGIVGVLLGAYGLGRFGGEMNSAKAAAILSTLVGVGLMVAATIHLLGA